MMVVMFGCVLTCLPLYLSCSPPEKPLPSDLVVVSHWQAETSTRECSPLRDESPHSTTGRFPPRTRPKMCVCIYIYIYIYIAPIPLCLGTNVHSTWLEGRWCLNFAVKHLKMFVFFLRPVDQTCDPDVSKVKRFSKFHGSRPSLVERPYVDKRPVR